MKFFDDNNMKSSDPIQPFNKPGGSTPGLKLDNTRGKGFYSLKFPFEFNDEEKRVLVLVLVVFFSSNW